MSMKKTEETIDEPCAVLISCNAGRTVLAVVWIAPWTLACSAYELKGLPMKWVPGSSTPRWMIASSV